MKRFGRVLLSAVVLVAIFVALIYFVPVMMLPGNMEEIQSIYIFDGSTGREITITDSTVIERIAEDFRGRLFKCKGLSLGMGSSYHLTFNYESGFRKFTLQFVDEVRRGHLSYTPVNGEHFTELYLYLDKMLEWAETEEKTIE